MARQILESFHSAGDRVDKTYFSQGSCQRIHHACLGKLSILRPSFSLSLKKFISKSFTHQLLGLLASGKRFVNRFPIRIIKCRTIRKGIKEDFDHLQIKRTISDFNSTSFSLVLSVNNFGHLSENSAPLCGKVKEVNKANIKLLEMKDNKMRTAGYNNIFTTAVIASQRNRKHGIVLIFIVFYFQSQKFPQKSLDPPFHSLSIMCSYTWFPHSRCLQKLSPHICA